MKTLFITILTITSLFSAWGDGYARQILANRLKDADSAIIKNLTYKNNVACGLVNAKNGFGAYTGYKAFVGAGDVVFFESDLKVGEFDKVWKKLCK